MFKFKLQTGEEMVSMYRQSEAVLFKPVVITCLLIYGPWAFLIKNDLHVRFSRILLFWTALVALYSIYKYALWLINVYIVTNRRLVAVNYKSLAHKIVLETPLDKIQNISFETNGIFKSLFKIGNLVIQIASLHEPMLLKNLKHPDEVKDSLWKIQKQFRGTHIVFKNQA